MNPRRRRHNKRARAERKAWDDGVLFRVVLRQLRRDAIGRAIQITQDHMADLLNRTVVPEITQKVLGYAAAVTAPVTFSFGRDHDPDS